jgi:magnesium transporter
LQCIHKCIHICCEGFEGDVALAAGPTMIAGIYGMNFENIPELGTEYGYFIILGVMVCLTGFLVRSFRKSGWL